MTKRTTAALLWLLAAWTGASMVTTFTGLPWLLAPAVGLLVGALVWWDPTGRLWGPPPDNARIRRRLADLPRMSESRRAAEPPREADATQG
jgi:hypothetical protein